ncbi:MAG: NAD(+) diphosphatase [Pseudomonadota bacterium]|nr:NAD(+) diphosphatase [Pseudomonadota bacterium]
MPTIVYGLLFVEQHLVVDAQSQLPIIIDPQPDELWVSQTSHVSYVARWVNSTDIPYGYQTVPIRQLLPQLSSQEFERISRAFQLLEWQRTHRFCSHCGTPTVRHTQGEFAQVCPACGHTAYPRVNPCVIVAITKGETILLARAHRFSTPMFSLIAGFVEVGETLEQAVAREVKEEVGLDIQNIQYVSSQPWPFPTNIMIGFTAEYAGGELLLQEDEIAEAHFYPFNQLPLIPSKGSIAHSLIQLVTQ